jgi:predicted ester cyclase
MPSNEALLRRITEEIWNERHVELIDELIAPDFVDHVEVPGAPAGGRARYRVSVESIHRAFPDYHEQIDFVVADADRAVSYVTVSGTHDGELHGLPPTGKPAAFTSIGILRFADGQAVERWGVGDALSMMGQLGLLG